MARDFELFHGHLPGQMAIRPDETLDAFIFRIGLHNEIRNLTSFKTILGVNGQNPHDDRNIAAAALTFGITPAQLSNAANWRLDSSDCKAWRHWFGTALPPKLLQTRYRRFTRSIGDLGYHPGVWMIAAASFCPLSFEEIWSACPACGAKLTWTTAHEIDECPRCGAAFSDQEAATLQSSLRQSYASAFELIDPDPIKRRHALKKLPAAFAGLKAGEAFCTLMSLAGALRGLARAKAGAERPFTDARRYDAPEPEDIAEAHDRVLRWPASLHELFAEFQTTVGSPRYRGGLHDLVNYLRANSKTSRLKELVEPELPAALQKTGVAFYAPKSSVVLSSARDGLVSVSEARAEFNIDNRTLERLSRDSTCLHARSPSNGGAVLYVRSELEKAISAYRSSRSFDVAGSSLGIPSFVIPAFVSAGLLASETNSDAIALAGTDELVTEQSIAELRSALRGYRGRYTLSSELVPLSRLLRWNVRAGVWADMAEAITLEKFKVRVVQPSLTCPSFDRLGATRDQYLKKLKDKSFEDNSSDYLGTASKRDVAMALGLNANAVRCAIAYGHLTIAAGCVDRVSYSSLLEFANTWISSTVAAEFIGRTARAWFCSYEEAGLTKLELGDIGKKPFMTLFKRDEVIRHHEAISPVKSCLRLI